MANEHITMLHPDEQLTHIGTDTGVNDSIRNIFFVDDDGNKLLFGEARSEIDSSVELSSAANGDKLFFCLDKMMARPHSSRPAHNGQKRYLML